MLLAVLASSSPSCTKGKAEPRSALMNMWFIEELAPLHVQCSHWTSWKEGQIVGWTDRAH